MPEREQKDRLNRTVQIDAVACLNHAALGNAI